MNLLTESWINVRRNSGELGSITPEEITDSHNTIVDVLAPRADLKGALYQFLIGLLQTTFAPEDEDEWEQYWHDPPAQDVLHKAFTKYHSAFEIDNQGPAFMQDFNLPEGEKKSISALFIEAPGGKTLRDNQDHFVKGGVITKVDAYWAALALFTLQINAPSGGVGHRVSLRGGGPLTTLVMPPVASTANSLWHALWLNVLTQEEIASLLINKNLVADSAMFPWLAATRTSEKKDGETHPEHCHPYQMYWSMPRRVRLDFTDATSGQCDLSGGESQCLVSYFITKNYGVNYTGNWLHPLTPYNVDPEKGAISIKGQPGGVTYRNWLGLVLDDVNNHRRVAKVVDVYNRNRRNIIGGDYQPRLWAFGYDMDKMKARCWYETTLPVFNIAQSERDDVQSLVSCMVDAATEVVGNVRSAVKNAWFNRPKDAKGDSSLGSLLALETSFWGATESKFYQLLEAIIAAKGDEDVIAKIKKDWRRYLSQRALDLFDQWSLSAANEDGDMKRMVKARLDLEKWLRSGKQIKKLAA